MVSYNLKVLVCISAFILAIHTAELKRVELDLDLQPSRRLERTPSYHAAILDEFSTVEVKFGDIYYESNELKENHMTVIISSNESGFFGDLYPYDDVDGFFCLSSYCLEDDSPPIECKSLWLQGTARRIILNTTLSTADGAWQLRVPALYFKEQPELVSGISTIGIGWIGLGTGSGAKTNFQDDNPIFSIIYKRSSKIGSLIFAFNSSLADMSKPSLVLSSDPTWQMQMVSLSIGDYRIYSDDLDPMMVIFDLGTSEIFLPEMFIESIIDQLKHVGLKCQNKHCISMDIIGLPAIVLAFSDGAQLSLGPEIYMTQTQFFNGTLLYHTIPFLSRRLPKNQKNQIILGEHILSYFYSVSQQLNGVNTITLYSIASNPIIEQGFSTSGIVSGESETQNFFDSSLFYDIVFVMLGFCFIVSLIFGSLKIFLKIKEWFEKRQSYQKHVVDMELSEQENDELT